MKSRHLFITLSLLLLISSAVYLRSSSFFGQMPQVVAEESSEQLSPQYFTYSQQKLAEALSSDKTVVLYFHAPWCTTCTSFDQELRTQPDALPPDVIVLQIDYDTHAALRQKYTIVQQHTLVLLRPDGTIQESWIGGDLKSVVTYLKKKRDTI